MTATSGKTTVQLGWTNPLTGVFGSHPVLGAALDLNDGQTYTLISPDGLELSPPRKTVVPTGNIRSVGERVTRAVYTSNREAVVRLILGPAANYAALVASVRQLVSWADAALSNPLTIKWQPPSATSPVYLDVTAAAHNIPNDERDWTRLQLEPIELAFYVRPALRGDRVWLQNLASNPGFEAPSGPGVTVFSDSFANANAYTVVSGGAPSVAGNVLTLAAGSLLTYGSPSWGAINQLRVRFQWVTGLIGRFFLHFVNGNNYLSCNVTNGSNGLALSHAIAGVQTTLASATTALTTGTFYWLTVTQFPAASGNPPLVQATLNADSAGAIGAVILSIGPVATADAVTSLVGKCGFQAISQPMAIGGAFANVLTVALFGPGAWGFLPNLSTATGLASGAWETNTANTYSGGPVTSFGAARVDLPPAGTVDAGWRLYGGAPVTGSLTAMPVTPGDTAHASVWVRSSGLSANAGLWLYIYEYDASGAQVTATRIALLTGNQAPWTQLAGSVVTQATTAYVGLLLRAIDTSVAGASANGMVWFDNVQCWDETLTGEASMPYCELRFPQSPAQLLVSGLLGDLPTPALVALGTYLASMAAGTALMWALGRRGQASSNAGLVGVGDGFQAPNTGGLTPTITAALDSSSYGGYYLTETLAAGMNPRAFSFAAADMLGVYHLLSRAWTAEAGGNLANVQTRIVTQQRSQAWFGASNSSDQIGEYDGPWTAPFASSGAGSTWKVNDSGQVNVPAQPAGALTDLTKNYLTPRSQWQDLTGGGAAFRTNWQMLLPIDGSLLLGATNNPTNSFGAVTTSWLWHYIDGLLTTRGGPGDGPAATYSVETVALHNAARAGGGPGTQASGAINVNLGADPFLTLDPQQAAVAGALGVNQLAGYVSDSAGDVLPIACDVVYTPLYLYPR